MTKLNPWLGAVLGKAQRLYEDSDRTSMSAFAFTSLLRRVHDLASRSAVVAPEPKLERLQLEDGTRILALEWLDDPSSWHLAFSVIRHPNERPYFRVEHAGEGPYYQQDNPTDDDIIRALNDYFERWKRP